MELTGLGGGIMLLIAAALWLVYLVPSWLKRREYLATERNAVRLQQTIRVLAETTEAPTQALRRAPRGPVAVGRPVQPVAPPAPRVLQAQRLRRTRMLATLALLVSLVVVGVQVATMIGGGVAAGSWLMLGAAILAAVGCLALLGRLAAVSRARQAPAARRVGHALVDHAMGAEAPVAAEWTPVPVPRPLYLSRAEAPAAAAPSSADLAQALRDAAERAAEALREAEPPSIQTAASTAEPAEQTAAAEAPTGRFAAMGIVDVAPGAATDLDAVLARRRAAS
jgi:hypothetical protein